MLQVVGETEGHIAQPLDLPAELLQGVAAGCRGLASSTQTCSGHWRTHVPVQHQCLALQGDDVPVRGCCHGKAACRSCLSGLHVRLYRFYVFTHRLTGALGWREHPPR